MVDQGITATRQRNCSYDVFLSFRGQDTRHCFVGSLYHALSGKGFNIFMDDEGLKEGDQIKRSLENAIQQSRISIVVFSENYASSTWCLDELVKILECMRLKNKMVWPIFYKVAPSDVRHQRNSYAEAMAKHEERFGDGSNKVQKWRSALSEAADLKGWHYEIGRYEYELIEEIVEKITTKLRREQLHDEEQIIEQKSWIEELKSSLQTGATANYQQPSFTGQANRTRGIVGPEYCAPYNVGLAIMRKVMTLADSFSVTDVNGKTFFNLKGSLMSLHDHRVLLDATGKPILTLRRKLMTAHDRWQVFRGESRELKDLIFSVKRSSMFQPKTKLDVFLANNTEEKVCDFKVKGSWFERSCVVYAGESRTVAAQMYKMLTAKSIVFGKDNFMVTVYPNVDYAFIVALILIFDEINQDTRQAET